jgi:hypothetical protein
MITRRQSDRALRDDQAPCQGAGEVGRHVRRATKSEMDLGVLGEELLARKRELQSQSEAA